MPIIVKRKKREIREIGTVTYELTGDYNVGKTIDFMGIAEGFRVTAVNVTVDEPFANADNTVAVGIEGDSSRFIAPTAMNALKGIPFNNRQLSATQSMAIVADVKGSPSSVGKATVTVSYVKHSTSRQDY